MIRIEPKEENPFGGYQSFAENLKQDLEQHSSESAQQHIDSLPDNIKEILDNSLTLEDAKNLANSISGQTDAEVINEVKVKVPARLRHLVERTHADGVVTYIVEGTE